MITVMSETLHPIYASVTCDDHIRSQVNIQNFTRMCPRSHICMQTQGWLSQITMKCSGEFVHTVC